MLQSNFQLMDEKSVGCCILVQLEYNHTGIIILNVFRSLRRAIFYYSE